MNYANYNLTQEEMRKSGERIRKICKEKGMTQYDMMALLGYKNRNPISECWNGTKLLKPEKYEILSEEWGIRIPYLLANDDYKTDDEFYSMLHSKYIRDFHIYLKPFFNYMEYDIEKSDIACETSEKLYKVDYDDNGHIVDETFFADCGWEFDTTYIVTTPAGDKLYIKKGDLLTQMNIFFRAVDLLGIRGISKYKK